VRKKDPRAEDIVPGRAARAAALISHYPREFVGLLMAASATFAICANALFMQSGPHPAPIFATRPLLKQSAPMPATRPAQLVAPAVEPVPANRAQLIADIQRELARKSYYDGAADGVWGARTDSAVRDFLQASGAKVSAEASDSLMRAIAVGPAKRTQPPARTNDPIAELIAPSKRVLAVQRALADFGYGQLKPSGVYDPETRAAIEKFERDHRLPVTGQISDRFVRALAGMTGRPLE
jgi:peptidoglycan hydrolase-like protein with peptidoglycan-binding domain